MDDDAYEAKCTLESCMNERENLKMILKQTKRQTTEIQNYSKLQAETELLRIKLVHSSDMATKAISDKMEAVNAREHAEADLKQTQSDFEMYRKRMPLLQEQADEAEKHKESANMWREKYDSICALTEKLETNNIEIKSKYEATVKTLEVVGKKTLSLQNQITTLKTEKTDNAQKTKKLDKYLKSAILVIDSLSSTPNLNKQPRAIKDLVELFRRDDVRLFFNSTPWQGAATSSSGAGSSSGRNELLDDPEEGSSEDHQVAPEEEVEDVAVDSVSRTVEKMEKQVTNQVVKRGENVVKRPDFTYKMNELRAMKTAPRLLNSSPIKKMPRGIRDPERSDGGGLLNSKSIHSRQFPTSDFDAIHTATEARKKALLGEASGAATSSGSGATIHGKKGKTVREQQSEMMARESVKEKVARMRAEAAGQPVPVKAPDAPEMPEPTRTRHHSFMMSEVDSDEEGVVVEPQNPERRGRGRPRSRSTMSRVSMEQEPQDPEPSEPRRLRSRSRSRSRQPAPPLVTRRSSRLSVRSQEPPKPRGRPRKTTESTEPESSSQSRRRSISVSSTTSTREERARARSVLKGDYTNLNLTPIKTKKKREDEEKPEDFEMTLGSSNLKKSPVKKPAENEPTKIGEVLKKSIRTAVKQDAPIVYQPVEPPKPRGRKANIPTTSSHLSEDSDSDDPDVVVAPRLRDNFDDFSYDVEPTPTIQRPPEPELIQIVSDSSDQSSITEGPGYIPSILEKTKIVEENIRRAEAGLELLEVSEDITGPPVDSEDDEEMEDVVEKSEAVPEAVPDAPKPTEGVRGILKRPPAQEKPEEIPESSDDVTEVQKKLEKAPEVVLEAPKPSEAAPEAPKPSEDVPQTLKSPEARPPPTPKSPAQTIAWQLGLQLSDSEEEEEEEESTTSSEVPKPPTSSENQETPKIILPPDDSTTPPTLKPASPVEMTSSEPSKPSPEAVQKPTSSQFESPEKSPEKLTSSEPPTSSEASKVLQKPTSSDFAYPTSIEALPKKLSSYSIPDVISLSSDDNDSPIKATSSKPIPPQLKPSESSTSSTTPDIIFDDVEPPRFTAPILTSSTSSESRAPPTSRNSHDDLIDRILSSDSDSKKAPKPPPAPKLTKTELLKRRKQATPTVPQAPPTFGPTKRSEDDDDLVSGILSAAKLPVKPPPKKCVAKEKTPKSSMTSSEKSSEKAPEKASEKPTKAQKRPAATTSSESTNPPKRQYTKKAAPPLVNPALMEKLKAKMASGTTSSENVATSSESATSSGSMPSVGPTSSKPTSSRAIASKPKSSGAKPMSSEVAKPTSSEPSESIPTSSESATSSEAPTTSSAPMAPPTKKGPTRTILIEVPTRPGGRKIRMEQPPKPVGLKEAIAKNVEKGGRKINKLKTHLRQALDLRMPVDQLKKPMADKGVDLGENIPLTPSDAVDVMMEYLRESGASDMWAVLQRQRFDGNLMPLVNKEEENFLQVSVTLNTEYQKLLHIFIRRILYEISLRDSIDSKQCGRLVRLFCHALRFVEYIPEEEDSEEAPEDVETQLELQKSTWMRQLFFCLLYKHPNELIKSLAFCLISEVARSCHFLVEELEKDPTSSEFHYAFRILLQKDTDQQAVVNWLLNEKFQMAYLVDLTPEEIREACHVAYKKFVGDVQDQKTSIYLAKSAHHDVLNVAFKLLETQMDTINRQFLEPKNQDKELKYKTAFSVPTITTKMTSVEAHVFKRQAEWHKIVLSVMIDNPGSKHHLAIMDALLKIVGQVVDFREIVESSDVENFVDPSGVEPLQEAVQHLLDLISEFTNFPLKPSTLPTTTSSNIPSTSSS